MKTLLFQGDSITDAGRFQDSTYNLGFGYVKLIAEKYANDNSIKILNRGISGNRVKDLKARWQEDCIALKPDILTILIGINDCWRKYDSNDETPIERFEEDYDYILKITKEKTNAQIILMEPFVLPVKEEMLIWRETLDPEIQVVRRLAKKYKTKLITLDAIFAEKATEYEYDELAYDGVHPTELGHKIIADAWIKMFELLIL